MTTSKEATVRINDFYSNDARVTALRMAVTAAATETADAARKLPISLEGLLNARLNEVSHIMGVI